MDNLSNVINQLKKVSKNGNENEDEELALDYDGNPLKDSVEASQNKDEDDDFNFSEYLQGSGIDWKEIYHPKLVRKESIASLIKSILKDTVNIDDYRADLIAAFALTPSAIVGVSPILFAYGESGSGKSGIGQLIAALYGTKPYGVTTYAGMRNLIHQKFINGAGTGRKEKNFCFIVDDIDSSFLSDSNIFSMLKSGCYRQYERIAISGKEVGTIEYFYCFCPKAFSSKFNLFNDKRFAELNRRFLPIPTTKSSVPKYDINGLDLTGIDIPFSRIWKNKDLCKKYSDSLRIANLGSKQLAKENDIPSDQFTILLSQAVTAMEFGVAEGIEEYFLFVKTAWKEAQQNAASMGLDEPCQKILKKYTKLRETKDEIYQVIKHQALVDAISYLRRKELTEVKMPEIKAILRNQGWTLETDLGDDNYWIKEHEETTK